MERFQKNPEHLRKLDRRMFEELVAELFKGFGFYVELTKRTRDGGRDIIAIKSVPAMVRFLIECKRPDEGNKVTVRAVRELLGVKTHERATKALLVTTAYFTKDARLLLDEHKWELEGKEYEGLLEWISLYLQQS